MKSNNFGYLLKEGIRGIFLHGFMSFAAVCVTVACLVIIGSFSVLLYNLNIMVAEVEQDAEILVYIDETYTEAEAKSVGSRINMIDNVYQATFVSRQEALEEFVAKQGDESAFDGLQADVLQDRFIVVLEDNSKMRETVPMIEAVDGVAEVNAPYQVAEALGTVQHILRIVSAAVIILLLVVSLLIISNTVKLAMYDRRDEIAIMKMVGATNGFIRVPVCNRGLPAGNIRRCSCVFPGVGPLQWNGQLDRHSGFLESFGLCALYGFALAYGGDVWGSRFVRRYFWQLCLHSKVPGCVKLRIQRRL